MNEEELLRMTRVLDGDLGRTLFLGGFQNCLKPTVIFVYLCSVGTFLQRKGMDYDCILIKGLRDMAEKLSEQSSKDGAGREIIQEHLAKHKREYPSLFKHFMSMKHDMVIINYLVSGIKVTEKHISEFYEFFDSDEFVVKLGWPLSSVKEGLE